MTTIAFIGLGNMGGPMAINLQKAGHAVRAFDLSKEAVAKVVAEGATAAFSAQDAVQGAKVVVTMLPASQHVEALFLGKDGAPGLLASIAPGTLVIDSSTIAAATSQKVAKAAEAAGIDFIDAPVSGGNWALEKYNPFPGVHENAPASKGYAGGFGTDLMLKDLGLAQENAIATKASTPLGGMARAIYAAHGIAGDGGEDFSSVIKMVQKKG